MDEKNEGLDPLFALQWMAALLSGDFKQAVGQLAQRRPDGEIGYCCLGVAQCLLAPSKAGKPDDRGGLEYSHLRATGIESQAAFIRLNDDEHKRFSVIARYIGTLPVKKG